MRQPLVVESSRLVHPASVSPPAGGTWAARICLSAHGAEPAHMRMHRPRPAHQTQAMQSQVRWWLHARHGACRPGHRLSGGNHQEEKDQEPEGGQAQEDDGAPDALCGDPAQALQGVVVCASEQRADLLRQPSSLSHLRQLPVPCSAVSDIGRDRARHCHSAAGPPVLCKASAAVSSRRCCR